METNTQQPTKPLCGCGRSPTGYCIGWHSLPEDQFQQKLDEWMKQTFNKEQPQ